MNTPEAFAPRSVGPATAFDAGDELEQGPLQGRSAFDFRYIAATIRSNLLLIIVIIAVSIVVAVVATLLDTPRYTARATIQINNVSDRVLNSDAEGPNAADINADSDRFLQTQLDILKSNGIALRVAQSLKLTGNPRFYAAEEVKVPVGGVSASDQRDLSVRLLQKNMNVTLPRDSRIATIAFNSTDPELSARVANAYATEFIQANLQRKYDSSSYARSFISDQLAQTKDRLETSERALNAYARQAGLIRTENPASGDTKNGGGGTTSGANSVTSSSLLQLNTAANAAKAERINAESRLRAINSVPLMTSREIVGNGAISYLMQQKALLEAQLQQERAGHLDDYPSVAAKRAQLVALNQQIHAQADNVRQSIKSDYDAARTNEAALTDQVSKLKEATLSEQDRTVQYSLLAREADTNRQVYDGLLQRFKELNAAAGISVSNLSIVDTADTPKLPSSPNLLKNLLVALLIGVGLAAVTVFFKDQFDDSIRVPEDVEHKLGLPLLGVIPKSSDTPDESLADPKSPMSEAYNSLRGSLLYSTPGGLPNVILVTSAQPAEGKSTTSHAMAAGLSRMGRSVVLIDADMRRPSLHRRNDADNERGLSTLLTSNEPIDDVLTASDQPNLSLLYSGPIPPSPTELISSPRMEHILQELAAKFDVVVIDSPPILGLADSPTMAALADGVVFVVEADRSRRGSLKAAVRRLRTMHPIILGAVLTKFDPLKSGNRYSEYYGYEYYQYAHKDA
ncbi:GumC family protein [Novosphingobium lentum]|uniref:GumC family protein n=1 Tax=Novosphingobium lentum TaxID=145287 RepID=UPI000A04882A|nr:polysaccharide biosynthesis tyrosine autokinase [Novosphingobium lentum]